MTNEAKAREMLAPWVTVEADAALYVHEGVNTILCDRLPRPLTLVLKNPVLRDGACLPSAVKQDFRTSLADRGGKSAAVTRAIEAALSLGRDGPHD